MNEFIRYVDDEIDSLEDKLKQLQESYLNGYLDQKEYEYLKGLYLDNVKLLKEKVTNLIETLDKKS